MGWDADEDALVEDVFVELTAMNGLPVDLETRDRRDEQEPTTVRGLLELDRDPAAVKLTVRSSDGRSLSATLERDQVVPAKLSPGATEVIVGEQLVIVGRVSLGWWRANGSAV